MAAATVANVKRVPECEAENAQMKRMYADVAFKTIATNDAFHRFVEPLAKRQIGHGLLIEQRPSVQRASPMVRVLGGVLPASYVELFNLADRTEVLSAHRVAWLEEPQAADRQLAAYLQRRAAVHQPRPGAAPERVGRRLNKGSSLLLKRLRLGELTPEPSYRRER